MFIKSRAKCVERLNVSDFAFCQFLVAFLGIFLLISSSMAQSSTELEVLKGNLQFSSNLYKILSEKSGNVFFSPISIHTVLSMAYQGANGSTAAKLASTLQVADAKAAADGYNAIIQRLNSVENVTLHLANKVYIMEGHSLLPEFSSAVSKNFQSEVQLVDFSNSVAAAGSINNWVEEKTNSKIKDLISKDDLNSMTRLVLLNAIYFKGDWKEKFDKSKTKTEPFYLNDVDTVEVQMMHTKKKFNYKNNDELDAQILELPYTNSDLSMIIILPNKRNGIGDLEKKLATKNLSDYIDGLWRIEVNLALPKFKIETTIDLEDSLRRLGLEEIFDEQKADFGGIIPLVGNENLYVSKVIQKAFIEVNEEGSEAAAATALIATARSGHLYFPVEANHPFVVQILHNYNGKQLILFQGRISNPL